MEHLIYWVWLQIALGVGNERSWKLLRYYNSPKKVFEHRTKNPGFLNQGDMNRMATVELNDAQAVIDSHGQLGFLVLCYDDESYPEHLKNTSLPPMVLYCTKHFPSLAQKLCIGVVGARKMSPYGREATEFLVEGLVKQGVVIVSGLAYGVDTIAHETTVKNEGETIAVVGCGLDKTYPAANRTLRELIETKGALVSEFPLGTPPFAANFPIRNRVISGLSHGLLVTEADEKSGTLITAKWAFEDSRDVFAVPSNIFSKTSLGSNRLIQRYAKLVTEPKDILEEYSYYFERQMKFTNSSTNPKTEPLHLEDRETEVLNFLSYQPVHIDDISLGVTPKGTELLEILTKLELLGHIDSYAGKRYSLKL